MATKAKAAPKKKAAPRVTAAPAPQPAEEVQPFEIALSTPGEDIPDGGRRLGCPSCGAKHDFVKAGHQAGQGGTWTVPNFKCLAPCGYEVPALPVG